MIGAEAYRGRPTTSRPNILLVVSDQHRLDCVGASNDYPVRTPNLDGLAREGAWFTSAYTSTPLCTPARQSLLTGQRAERTGGLWNYDLGPRIPALDPAEYAWPRELQRSGYRSRYVGKWHVNPDHDPVAFGYDSYLPLSAYETWRAEQHPDQPLPTDWFGAVDEVPTAASRTHWLADQGSSFIREHAGSDSPWHLRLDFLEPHLPCQPTREFADRYPVTEVRPWRDFADDLTGKPYIQRQQLLNWGVEDWEWGDWAPIVARYHAIIEQLDDAIGSVLRTLDDVGAAEDTLVVYTTDHGDMNGSHRMMDKHYVMYDDVVRVPLILRWPGRIAPGSVVDGLAYNTLDLPPTVAAVTGIPGPDPAHGTSLLEPASSSGADLQEAAAIRRREHVVSTYNGQQFGLYIQRMIRTRTWKYVWNPTDVDELYDLDADPEEFTNRIADQACTSTLAELRRRLYDQLSADDDSFVANSWMRDQLLTGRKLATR